MGLLIWGFINWQKNGQFFGNYEYNEVNITELLSFSNFYSGQKICTKGFYLQTSSYTILKVSLSEDEYTRSLWVYDPQGREIITRLQGQNRGVIATICGTFTSSRGGQYGTLPVWNHQLIVERFETEGDPFELER